VPLANDAWAEVVGRVRKGGFWYADENGLYHRRAPTAGDWSHPLIDRAIEGIGGWRSLTDPDALDGVNRARFLEAYRTYQERQRQDQALLPMVREAVGQLRAGRQGGPISLGDAARLLTQKTTALADGR